MPTPYAARVYIGMLFLFSLASQEPVRTYNFSKMGIRYIADVVDDQGQISLFPQAMTQYGLGMHHRPIWKNIRDLWQPLLPIPPLSHEDMLDDWKLCLVGLNLRLVPLRKLTSKQTCRLLQPMPWIHIYANQFWHLQKTLCWWSKNLNVLWKAKLPLKQRLFLWRCITCTLPVGATLVKRKIATATTSCLHCHAPIETIPHLLWYCPCSKSLIGRISRLL